MLADHNRNLQKQILHLLKDPLALYSNLNMVVVSLQSLICPLQCFLYYTRLVYVHKIRTRNKTKQLENE